MESISTRPLLSAPSFNKVSDITSNCAYLNIELPVPLGQLLYVRHNLLYVDCLLWECDCVGVDGVVAEGHDVVVPIPHIEAEGVLLVDAVRAVLLFCFSPEMNSKV
jgi:hypothetical protein